ncbi:MAG: hypothetical protein E6772_16045 [Dysgonomonas sp.]|nr:hypothetical protein [Dysgonomonas sp.]
MDLFLTNADLINLSKKSESLNAISVMDMDSYIFVILRILETAMKGNNRLWLPADGLTDLEEIRKVLLRSYIQTDLMDNQLYICW